MPKKKEDVAVDVVVAGKPVETKAVPSYDVAERYKHYTGILVGNKLVKVADGKVFADDKLHKMLAEGGFLK